MPGAHAAATSCCGIRLPWSLENLRRRRALNNCSSVNYGDLVCETAGQRQIVSDQHVGERSLPLQGKKKICNLRLHRNVESDERLIQHQEFRVEHQSAGDCQPLPLSSAKFVRTTLSQCLRQTNLFHQLKGLGLLPAQASRVVGFVAAPRRPPPRENVGSWQQRSPEAAAGFWVETPSIEHDRGW